MENQDNIGSQNAQQIGQNLANQPVSVPEKMKVNYWMISTIILAILLTIAGIYIYINIKPSVLQTKSNQQLQSTNSASKQYVNSFYHIKFDIPSDWLVEESVKNDGTPIFKLSSPNKEISIESPLPESTPENHQYMYYTKTDLKAPEVQLGKYTVGRGRYVNKFDKIMDYIDLYNIPNQKTLGLFFTVNGNFETNNSKLLAILKTFAFTQEEPILDSLITYTIPNGWKKEELNPANESPDKVISLVSPDLEENPILAIIKGARIRVSRFFHDPSKTLKDEIINRLPLPLREKTDDIAPVKLSSLDGLNKFECWEGCYDTYYLIKDDYVWNINFSCTPTECSTKAGMESSKYRSDRDVFLNTLKFK